MTPDQLSSAHHARLAYVHIRQSSLHQVLHHLESQRRQRSLVERAVQLGWAPERVQVLDEDLGQSGARSQRRSGFERLALRCRGGGGTDATRTRRGPLHNNSAPGTSPQAQSAPSPRPPRRASGSTPPRAPRPAGVSHRRQIRPSSSRYLTPMPYTTPEHLRYLPPHGPPRSSSGLLLSLRKPPEVNSCGPT